MRFLRTTILLFTAAALAPFVSASAQSAPTKIYITMHTAPMDNYCPPCMASEKLLKDAGLEFRKILEPMGPWPWFVLVDERGNQRTIRRGLKDEDIASLKKGEFPGRD
jgi:hypothetical protein